MGKESYKLLNKCHINIVVSHIKREWDDFKTYRLDMEAMLDGVRYAWAILILPEEIRMLQRFIYDGVLAFKRMLKKKNLLVNMRGYK